MSKSEGIKCLRCGHILSLDELEKRQCNRCKKHLDEPTSTSFEERMAKKHGWVKWWKELWAKSEGMDGEAKESKKEKGKGGAGTLSSLHQSQREGGQGERSPLIPVGLFIGMVLVAIGTIALLTKLNVLSWSLWGYAWPIILIMLGLVFIFGRRR